MATDKTNETPDLSYRQAIREIESILGKIEKQDLDVDELAEKLKRVNELIRLCKKKLFTAEKEVEKILKEME
ncbi:MAG: exodeoxyribonuclease VII small subunit [Bacteroidetes bacterium GWF2_49_14]|nr:MAG: exodeoxyribonuclease VII small subunit [Bacteroidetes bacterium GWF2_49_14]HBB92179.1 exodeoxyribonuclease VII small subunit [Bacteroidales bacterium]